MSLFGPSSSSISTKDGTKYANIKNQIRDFDLIVFSGDDFVSKFIMDLSSYEMGKDAGHYSHCGMIISRNVLNNPKMEEGEWYIFESTMSGKLTDGILDIYGDTFFGAQVRKFDDVMKAYDAPLHTQVRWCKFHNNPLDHMDINDVRSKMQVLFDEYNHRMYEINLSNMFFAMFPKIRKYQPSFFKKDPFVFCSELVGIIYVGLGALASTVIPMNIVPADFIVQDPDGQIDYKMWTPTLITY